MDSLFRLSKYQVVEDYRDSDGFRKMKLELVLVHNRDELCDLDDDDSIHELNLPLLFTSEYVRIIN